MYETIDRVLTPIGLKRWLNGDMDFRKRMADDCSEMVTQRGVAVRIVDADGRILQEFKP